MSMLFDDNTKYDWAYWEDPKQYCGQYKEHRLYHAIGKRCPCHISFGRPYINVPEFEIVSCPTISLEEVENRRFNVVKK